jgi:hypothetical protein
LQHLAVRIHMDHAKGFPFKIKLGMPSTGFAVVPIV